MKKVILLFALFFVSISFVNAQGILNFSVTEFDFGKIKEGEIATHKFVFTNTGTAPVIISSANPACGCTVADWTKDPVMPGKSGYVTASFNSSGRPNAFTKTATVVSNSETPQLILTLKGFVIPKEKPAEAPAPVVVAPAPVPPAPAPAPVVAVPVTSKVVAKPVAKKKK